MIKALIFDMDGVLLDSEWIYLHSLQAYLKSLNVLAKIDELAVVVGMKMDAISTYLKMKYHLKQTISELSEQQNKYFDQYVEQNQLIEMEGLTEFLQYLKSLNIKVALASSSDMQWINQVIGELSIQEYFDLIVSGEDVENSKPHPEIFKLAAMKLGLNESECVVVEDSVNGIQAGKAANMIVIGYKGSKIIQDTSFADKEVHSFKELMI